MRKVIRIMILTFCAIGLFFSGAYANESLKKVDNAYFNDDFKISINGKKFIPREADGSIIKPILRNDRTFLPLRALSNAFQSLGIKIDYDADTNTAMLTVPNLVKENNDLEIDAIPDNALDVLYNSDDDYLRVKIDKTRLPEYMKGFSKVSLMRITQQGDSASESINILQSSLNKNELNIVDYKESGVKVSGEAPMIFSIYDENSNILSIKLIYKGSSIIKTYKQDKSNIIKLSEEVNFTQIKDKEESKIKINVEKSSSFNVSKVAYINICNTPNPTEETAMLELRYEFINGGYRGLMPYNCTDGIITSSNKPAIIYLFDRDKNPIAYYLWN